MAVRIEMESLGIRERRLAEGAGEKSRRWSCAGPSNVVERL